MQISLLREAFRQNIMAFSPRYLRRPFPSPSSPPSLGFRDRAELLDSTFLRMGMLAVLRSRCVCTCRKTDWIPAGNLTIAIGVALWVFPSKSWCSYRTADTTASSICRPFVFGRLCTIYSLKICILCLFFAPCLLISRFLFLFFPARPVWLWG